MITIPDAMRRPAEVERDELKKQLAEARAEIERLKAPTTANNLDERLKAAGMLTVTELLAGTPLDKFCAHVGVNTMQRFEEWLLMRREEFLDMKATMLLDGKEHDGLYEWVLAHGGALAEVLANFRQAKPDVERKDVLIEQMRLAMGKVVADFRVNLRDLTEFEDKQAKILEAALAAGRSEG